MLIVAIAQVLGYLWRSGQPMTMLWHAAIHLDLRTGQGVKPCHIRTAVEPFGDCTELFAFIGFSPLFILELRSKSPGWHWCSAKAC